MSCQAWDDVVPKTKPANDGYDYRKRVVLDQEKSKLGLADQYALEFQREAAKLTQVFVIIVVVNPKCKKSSVGLALCIS